MGNIQWLFQWPFDTKASIQGSLAKLREAVAKHGDIRFEKLNTKTQCESDRMVHSKIVNYNAQGMDGETTRVARNQVKIDEKTHEIEDIVAQVKDLKPHRARAFRAAKCVQYGIRKIKSEICASITIISWRVIRIGKQEISEMFCKDIGLCQRQARSCVIILLISFCNWIIDKPDLVL